MKKEIVGVICSTLLCAVVIIATYYQNQTALVLMDIFAGLDVEKECLALREIIDGRLLPDTTGEGGCRIDVNGYSRRFSPMELRGAVRASQMTRMSIDPKLVHHNPWGIN